MDNTTQPSATRPRGSAKFAEQWKPAWLAAEDVALLFGEIERLTKLNDQLFACWLHRLGGGK